MKQSEHFKVIEGGLATDEALFQRLLKEPHRFAQEEFEQTVDLFRARLTIDNIIDLMAHRVRNRDYSSRLEQQTLLAIVEGRNSDVERLFDILDRRNARSLTVISSSWPTSPAQFP